MQDAKILVVDDEPLNLEIIGEYLSEGTFGLEMAESGEAAWAALTRDDADFDLVLLDRMMPSVDGMEVLRRMKAEPRLRDVPVIMQTAAATPQQVREGLQAGAHYYLTKPFEQGALLAIIRAALGERLARRELAQKIGVHQNVINLIQRAAYEVRSLDDAQALCTHLAQFCPAPETAAMGISELLVNAIEHGNLGITYAEKSRLKQEDRWLDEVNRRLALPEYAYKKVEVALERRGDEVVINIRDQGDGFEWKRFLDFDPARAFDPNGRGIALARNLAFTRVEYLGKGNEVEAVVAAATLETVVS